MDTGFLYLEHCKHVQLPKQMPDSGRGSVYCLFVCLLIMCVRACGSERGTSSWNRFFLLTFIWVPEIGLRSPDMHSRCFKSLTILLALPNCLASMREVISKLLLTVWKLG